MSKTTKIEAPKKEVVEVVKPKFDYTVSSSGMSYGSDVFKKFDKKDPKAPFHIGIELEIEGITDKSKVDKDQMARVLRKYFDPHIFVYTDGSVSQGLETCTHPMSIDYFQTKFPIADILECLEEANWSGDSDLTPSVCGMHIHVSKSAFTKLSFYRLTSLAWNNKDFFNKLSERNLSRNYAPQYQQPTNMSLDIENKAPVFSPRRETVEYRLYSSTVKLPNYLKNVESAVALADFAKLYTLEETTLQHFLEYVDYNKEIYPNLNNFIKK